MGHDANLWPPKEPPTPRRVRTLYGVGVEDAAGKFVLTHGPAFDEDQLLQVIPDDDAVLVRFDAGVSQSFHVCFYWDRDGWCTREPEWHRRAAQSRQPQFTNHSATDLDSRQLASVLAGLRALQRGSVGAGVLNIASDDGALEPLSTEEIDSLAERINVIAAPPVTRVVVRTEGGVLHEAFADGAFELVVLDADTEGGDEDQIADIEGESVYVTRFGHGAEAVDLGRVQAIFEEIGAQLDSFDEQVAAASESGAEPGAGENDQPPALLESCSTVSRLLKAVQRAVAHVADPAVRQDLLNHLEPFTRGVAVAFYSRSEMAQQAPMDVEVTDAEADAALEQLVRNFQHPWDTFTGQFSEEVFARGLGELKAARRPRES